MRIQHSSFVFAFNKMFGVVVLLVAALSSLSTEEVECEPGQWRCDDGQCAKAAVCDGELQCRDGSDESLARCKGIQPGQWRCDDGQCAKAAVCDGELQCRDGSDESLARCKGIQRPVLALILHCSQPGSSISSRHVCPEACRRWPDYCYYAIAAENGVPGTCELPAYPSIGDYSIEAIERAPSAGLADFTLLYSCPPGYTLSGNHPRCVSGSWTASFPSCRQDRRCQLKKHPSVDYECVDVPNRKCPEWVSSGQRVSAACRPGYMRTTSMSSMFCNDGVWNYVATCQSDCGTVSTPSYVATMRGEVPWHTGVYSKLYSPYMQLCGGSLVTTTVVISAAHCFWTEGKGVASADYFAVAVGKVYRSWDRVDYGQKSNVTDIKVPPRFRGVTTNYQDDIALVVLATRVVLTVYVRPVCVDFAVQSDELQLRPSNVGKIAVWNRSPVLKVLEMASVDVTQCIKKTPPDFGSFITSDKICARPRNGTAICRGDSGGGLAFSFTEFGKERWYLRGIASTAPRTETDCVENYVAFTQIAKHHSFITSVIPGYPQSKGP